MNETLLQFGSSGSAAKKSPSAEERRGRTICLRCGQHFSPDGRFCPFDGQALIQAPGWDPSTDPLLGTLVDNRYEVLSLLGEGGMGLVYEVRHRALGKHFALKALRRELACDTEISARFMQEARTAACVSHPGLVEITDFGRLSTGQPFFVMELLGGQSLASLIRRGGPIPAARAVDIVRQITEALGVAHEQSIVHRDLKPDNIHISPTALGPDRVTIVDFGLAKVIGASRLTRAGVVFGTPHYMSPEQAMGETTDHRADIYALGVVMYEMFTGRVPFEADSYMGVLTKHMYMVPTPPSELPGTEQLGVLEDILLRCLQKKPEHRYGSLRELRDDLDLALDPGGEPPSATRQRRAVPPSLLADELELPDRQEASFSIHRPPTAPRPMWPLLVVGGLFLAGISGALALRRSTAVARAAVPKAAINAAPARHAALPSALLRSVPAPVPSASVEPSAVSRSEPPAARVFAHSSAPPRTAAQVRVVRSAPAVKNVVARPGSSEIVDPWAK